MIVGGLPEPESSQRVADLYRRHVSRGRARLGEMLGARVEVSSSGSIVRDHEGHDYLDCGGYGVFLLGHRNPRVTAAVIDQVNAHPLATRMLLEPRLGAAAEALARVAPEGLDFVHFVGSGTEATETALKIARINGHRRVIAMENGYHGKTLGALAATGRELYRAPFAPLLPDVSHVGFGDLGALEAELASGPSACVIVEPVQAEGGVVIPPPGYLADVARLCREHGAFLVADEIQTGLGRLGAWWGVDREGVVPDVLLAGKTLSGGVVPVAAAISTASAYAPFSRDPYLHTSTFAGSPIACAAAEAAVEEIEQRNVVKRARILGDELLAGLGSIVDATAVDVRARGVGLLIGVEFGSALSAAEFVVEMLGRRVIVSHSLNAERVVRLTPPVTLTPAEVSWLLDAVRESLAALSPTPTPNERESCPQYA